MSGHGFHVHGPHDHEVEHVAQHGGDNFTSRIAVLTAVLSTVGAIFGYMGGHSQNAALLYKNDAAIQKTAASNQWNYYQAKSNKQNLAELSVTLTTGRGAGKVQGRHRALQEGKGRDQGRGRQAGSRSQGFRRAQQPGNARSRALGAGHHADPDCHRAVRHHPAHPQTLDAGRRLRRLGAWPGGRRHGLPAPLTG